VHLEIASAVRVVLGPHLVAGGCVGGDDRNQRHDTVPGEQFGHEPDPAHVGVPVLAGKAQPGGQATAQRVTVEHLDLPAGRAQLPGDGVGDRRLAGPGQPGQPDGGAPAHRWIPHSVLTDPAQRPARGPSPAATARVHGAQPIDR
jgi:hypothetical protein